MPRHADVSVSMMLRAFSVLSGLERKTGHLGPLPTATNLPRRMSQTNESGTLSVSVTIQLALPLKGDSANGKKSPAYVVSHRRQVCPKSTGFYLLKRAPTRCPDNAEATVIGPKTFHQTVSTAYFTGTLASHVLACAVTLVNVRR